MNKQEFLRRLEYLLRGIPENERIDALTYYENYFDEAGMENEQKVIAELGTPEQAAQMILADFESIESVTSRDYGAPEDAIKPVVYGSRQQGNEAYTRQDGQWIYGTYGEQKGQQRYGTYEEESGDRRYRTYEEDNSRQRYEAYGEPSSQQSYGTYENQNTQQAYGTYEDVNHRQTYSEKKPLSKGVIIAVVIAILTFPFWIGIAAGAFGILIAILSTAFSIVVALGGSGIGLFAGGILLLIMGILTIFSNVMEGFAMVGVGALCAALGIILVLLFALLVFQWLPIPVKAMINKIKGLRKHSKGVNEV